MKAQRGVADLWLIGIAILALLLVLYGIAHTWSSSIANADKNGYERGKQEVDASYKGRDNAQLQLVIAENAKLKEAATALEAKAKADIQTLIAQLTKEKQDAQTNTDRVLADIASGKLRLRVGTLQTGTCATVNNSSAPGAAPSAPGGNNDPTGAQLLDDVTAAFLASEAARADEVVRQLTGAQNYITKITQELCK